VLRNIVSIFTDYMLITSMDCMYIYEVCDSFLTEESEWWYGVCKISVGYWQGKVIQVTRSEVCGSMLNFITCNDVFGFGMFAWYCNLCLCMPCGAWIPASPIESIPR
jgi:hypothetical protein